MAESFGAAFRLVEVTPDDWSECRLHTNIARSYNGLASQVEMLGEDVAEAIKGWD
jgi:hypothetical protein